MVNNNEMGVLIGRAEDVELYRGAYDAAQRINRSSEEIRISLQRVEQNADRCETAANTVPTQTTSGYDKLRSAKLAVKMGVSIRDLLDRLTTAGLLELKSERYYVTPEANNTGGEWRPGPGGGYFLWPAALTAPHT